VIKPLKIKDKSGELTLRCFITVPLIAQGREACFGKPECLLRRTPSFMKCKSHVWNTYENGLKATGVNVKSMAKAVKNLQR